MIQKLLDSEGTQPLRLILCGSSQRMMQGLVLDESAPLYGRAGEIIKVSLMPPRALHEALQLVQPPSSPTPCWR